MIFTDLIINHNETIYTQIENYIEKSIDEGLLQKGSKLPSTRDLSRILKVSRNTVIAAYENLSDKGIIMVKKGKGTFIKIEGSVENSVFSLQWKNRINDYGISCENLDVVKSELKWKKGMISFKSIAPEESLFDLSEFKRAFLQGISIEENKILNYGYAKGYDKLIDYLKGYMMSKGIDLSGKDIIITNGFTEGLNLLVRILCNEGDEVLCENPTHNTALKIMKSNSIKLIGIPMDSEGPKISDLECYLEKKRPKFMYITPSYHNPTGIVMTGNRRREVYMLLREYNVPIIEDGFNEELLYSSSHIPSITSLDKGGNGTIYIGSFSKILFPGIRIGWILGDKNLINTLESVKRTWTIHTSTLDQMVLYNYLKNGDFHKYVSKVRRYYRDKYNYTLDLIKKYIPYEHITGEGGLYIFIKLKNRLNSRIVLEKAYGEGVVFMPGDIFYCDEDGKDTMRISFSRVSESDIEKGIKIIGGIIKELT